MDKFVALKKNAKRRRGKENAVPDPLNNSLLENLLKDNINDIVGRRSDVGKRSLRLDNDESISDVDNNNDDLEKEERRKAAERDRVERERTAAASGQSGLSLLNTLSQAELDQHYSKCIEMCNKNKVNVKNAFKLQLIDYMKLIVTNQSTKSENLTLMSCTLGASAKIYAHRVDKVYADMIKIVSGKGGEIEVDESSGDENEGDGADEPVTSKRKKAHNDSSDEEVEEDDRKIDMEKMLLSETQLDKSKGEVEPLEKTYLPRNLEYFVECWALDPDGRFCLNPPVFSNGHLNKPSNTCFISMDEPCYTGSHTTLNLCEYIKDYKDIRKCFSNFGGGEEIEENSGMINSSLTFDPSSNIDIPDAIRIETEDHDMDCGDGVAPESWVPDYDEEYDSDKEISHERRIGQVSVNQPHSFNAKAMARLVSADAGDYSFFNSNIDLWAGPRHWTIKRPRVGEKVLKSSNEQPKKTVKKSCVVEFSEEKVKEVKQLYSDVVSGQLTRRTIMTWSGRRTTFPREIIDAQKKLFSLMKNENVLFIKKDSTTSLICNSDLNNEEQALLTPDDFGGDMCHDEDEDDSHHFEDGFVSILGERPPSPPIDIEEEEEKDTPDDDDCDLVPAPQKVLRVDLKFAKTQKRIDIKNLKNVIWESMSLELKNGKNVNFSNIFSTLPEKLPSEDAAALSFPIAFMALLHMANEKTLALQGTEDNSDASITLG